MRKLTATLCLTFAVLLGSKVEGAKTTEYGKPVEIKGSEFDTSMTIQLSKDARKFRATVRIGFAKSECVGEIKSDHSIISEACVFDFFMHPEEVYISGKFPNFIFNEDGVCVAHSGHGSTSTCETNISIKFLYPTSSQKSIAEKEIERLRKRIAALEKQNQSEPKQVAKRPPPKKSPSPSSGSTGSGFFVSKLGHILTNEHVVRKCGSVTVGDNANKQVTASVLEKDKRNDLALLRISSTQMASAETLSLISKLNVQKLGLKLVPLASGGLMRSDDIELGERVLVSGFPYGELYSNTIKVTGGMVSAVKGMGDDSAQFQMDAAVQPGNSGGPIYDENGNIVGVVVSQLDPLKVAKTIGSLPQNVNFGIKASTVRQFLTSAGLPTKWSNRTKRKSTKELAQIAKNQTVMVVCNP